MPNHDDIYMNEAQTYQLLVSKQPKLISFVEQIRKPDGLDIVDIGAGTGRFTSELARKAKSIVALDGSQAMLDINAGRLKAGGLTNWRTAVADHRALPLEDGSADLVVAGWTICYLCNSNEPHCERNLEQIMAEIRRILRPDGTVVIFETMGTGEETPNPPGFLRSYYAALTERYGFAHRWIRTDYTFESLEQAERLSRFFFGDEMAERVIRNSWVQLPECAGVWWK